MVSDSDPFADLDECPVEIPAVDSGPKPSPGVSISDINLPVNGSIFVFDVETVVDESRYPRPEMTVPSGAPDFNAETVQQGTVAAIKKIIPTLTVEQLDELLEAEQNAEKKGNRDGVLKEIEKAKDSVF